MRGVGHELALAVERVLGLAARGAQLAEHGLEGVREVGDLVVGLGLGQGHVGVARAGHLAGGAGEAGDGPHRALGHVEAAEKGEQRAPDHAEREEDAHAADRARDGALGLAVLDEAGVVGHRLLQERAAERLAGAVARDGEGTRHYAVIVDGDDPLHTERNQGRQAPGKGDLTAAVEQAHLGVAQARCHQSLLVGGCDLLAQAVEQVGGRGSQVVVEAGADALLGHRADHHGKEAEDPEGQRGGDHRQLELDRQPGPHASLNT